MCSCVLHICTPGYYQKWNPRNPLPKVGSFTRHQASSRFPQLASNHWSLSPVGKRDCIAMASPWTPLQNSTLCYFTPMDPHLIRLGGPSILQGAKLASRESVYTISLPPNWSGSTRGPSWSTEMWASDILMHPGRKENLFPDSVNFGGGLSNEVQKKPLLHQRTRGSNWSQWRQLFGHLQRLHVAFVLISFCHSHLWTLAAGLSIHQNLTKQCMQREEQCVLQKFIKIYNLHIAASI